MAFLLSIQFSRTLLYFISSCFLQNFHGAEIVICAISEEEIRPSIM